MDLGKMFQMPFQQAERLLFPVWLSVVTGQEQEKGGVKFQSSQIGVCLSEKSLPHHLPKQTGFKGEDIVDKKAVVDVACPSVFKLLDGQHPAKF